MIPILDAAGAPEIVLPLACDPAVIAANTPEDLSAFVSDGDSTRLTVPDGATLVTIRALDAAELGAAERAAGRRSHLGQVLMSKAPKDDEAKARWLDGLSDADLKAVEEHKEWRGRVDAAVAEAGVVSVVLQGEAEAYRFPSAALFVRQIPSPALSVAIMREMAWRVSAYSGLGTRPKGLCNSRFGWARLSGREETLGDATSAQPSDEPSAAIAGAISLQV